MEKIFDKIKVVRQTIASGKVLECGEYSVGKDVPRADAIALIRMGKALPLSSPAPVVEHREVEITTRDVEPEPEPMPEPEKKVTKWSRKKTGRRKKAD